MGTKREFRFFTHFEVEKEEAYLRRMHQSGWRFVKVSGPCIYRFERCTPEDVLYQLDYSKDGREHKDTYVKMFDDCGWEYLQDYVGYSYFRKPASDATEAEGLFRDGESKRWMLEQALEERLQLLGPLLFLCGIVLCFVIAIDML